jgi:hypothetical protein
MFSSVLRTKDKTITFKGKEKKEEKEKSNLIIIL